MDEILADLLAEYRELADLCETLSASQWQARSAFYGWTPWDEIAHLLYFDETALQSTTDAEAFARDAAALQQRLESGLEISAITREQYGTLDGPALLAAWRPRFEALIEALRHRAPRDRLTWYGPPMSARSFATARLMETWAHGQDVWDVSGRARPANARLKHIAHIGVSTYGWTFINRGLPVPEPAPHVALTAPDGETWTWGEPSDTDYVRGLARDFCLVVTQRRNVVDTRLQYEGEGARQWLPIAQCFAGAPADGPAPGVRASALDAV